MGMKETGRGRWQHQNHLQHMQKQVHQHQQKLPRQYSCRPPRAPASADPCRHCQAVPLWEKKFCVDECRVLWWRICESRKVLEFMYEKVKDWDNSAGEEAMSDAMRRYWAKINGLPCDIPLPDPDMYIDAVDHDACIDVPELLEGFDKPSAVTDDDSDEASPELDSFPNYANMAIPVSGWGDEFDEHQVPVSGWGDADDPIPVTGWGDAEYSVPVTGWGDAEDAVLQTNGYVDHQATVPLAWDDSNGGRKDKPWTQRKSNGHERRGRRGKKGINGCQQIGKKVWLP